MPESRHDGRVLITPRSLTVNALDTVAELVPLVEAGFDLISSSPGRMPTEEELLELVVPCVGWLAGIEPISAKVLDRATKLRIISRNGVGVDNIDLEAAERRGVRVARTPGANAQGVAELALALILSALRGIPKSDRVVRDGGWRRWQGRELKSCTIGILGYGVIGRTLAGMLTGLGANVMACDPVVDLAAVPLVTIDELLRSSDVVSLHAPAAPGGRPLLTAAEFGLMRPGSVLVNTSRASLVDDEAVLAALNSGTLDCYAVDVFDAEPPEPSALHCRDDVILTPHIGGFTIDSTQRSTRGAVANLLEVLDESQQ
jgi:phosphoglycerate dehydrogenase-like enzyme